VTGGGDVDFSAEAMLELIDALFAEQETVNKYDIVQQAKFFPLGADGERAVADLPPKRYKRDALTDALAHAVIERGGKKNKRRPRL
jgi:hypothetical protein